MCSDRYRNAVTFRARARTFVREKERERQIAGSAYEIIELESPDARAPPKANTPVTHRERRKVNSRIARCGEGERRRRRKGEVFN